MYFENGSKYEAVTCIRVLTLFLFISIHDPSPNSKSMLSTQVRLKRFKMFYKDSKLRIPILNY